jgi:hypothetical protein
MAKQSALPPTLAPRPKSVGQDVGLQTQFANFKRYINEESGIRTGDRIAGAIFLLRNDWLFGLIGALLW